MGVVNIPGGGGGGILSEELGATAEFVLKDLSYVGNDTDDEAGTGKMPNIGAQTGALNCGESVDISKGYHDGTGKITANSLASQTSATATAARILKGDTAWVNGVKLTGTVEVSSIPSFSVAAYSTSQLTFTWKNPAAASGRPFSGVIICCKTGSYPTGPTDGFKYMGTGSNSAAGGTSSVTLSGFTAGTTYYCRIWAYCVCSAGNYTINSTKVLVSSGYMSATKATYSILTKTFTSSTTYTIPEGYHTMDVFCVGGGGAGGFYYKNNYGGTGNGGGGGYTATKKGIAVSAGDSCTITVGTGGSGAQGSTTSTRNLGNNGGASSVVHGSTTVTAAGGYGGNTDSYESADKDTSSNGGSGGGVRCYSSGPSVASYIPRNGTSGGSNGADGTTYSYTSSSGKTYYRYAGKGQGSTTMPFGASSGTKYSGGGGGASGSGDDVYPATTAGAGGSYGGGKGARVSVYDGGVRYNDAAVSGTANSGGGGGGGCQAYAEDGEGDITTTRSQLGKAGGSGVVIIKLY